MTSGPIPSPGRIAMSGIVSAPTLPCRPMRGTTRFALRSSGGFLSVAGLLSLALACGGADEKPAQTPSSTAQPASPSPPPDPAASGGAAADPKNSNPPAAATGGGDWPFTAQSAEDRAAQLERLKKDPGPIRSNWTPPGKSERYGHA